MADPAPANDAGLADDDRIHRLWKSGLDTLSIARALSRPGHEVPECEIYNRMIPLRERYRKMCGGGK